MSRSYPEPSVPRDFACWVLRTSTQVTVIDRRSGSRSTRPADRWDVRGKADGVQFSKRFERAGLAQVWKEQLDHKRPSSAGATTRNPPAPGTAEGPSMRIEAGQSPRRPRCPRPSVEAEASHTGRDRRRAPMPPPSSTCAGQPPRRREKSAGDRLTRRPGPARSREVLSAPPGAGQGGTYRPHPGRVSRLGTSSPVGSRSSSTRQRFHQGRRSGAGLRPSNQANRTGESVRPGRSRRRLRSSRSTNSAGHSAGE